MDFVRVTGFCVLGHPTDDIADENFTATDFEYLEIMSRVFGIDPEINGRFTLETCPFTD